jgi:uncharacterized membrane protein
VPRRYRNVSFGLAAVLLYVTGLLETYFQSHALMENAVANAVTASYHMAFSLIAVVALGRSQWGQGFKLALCSVNIALYSFVFMFAPFVEHASFIADENSGTPAFWLHFALLAATVYFMAGLYRSRHSETFANISRPLLAITAAVLVVYLASAELLLVVQHLSNTVITNADAAKLMASPDQLPYAKEQLAHARISSVNIQVVKTGFPVLWGSIAFLLLIAGIRKRSKPLRIVALALLGLTILKLFAYDIRNASETGKIVAFIMLGVLILIISFVYQKLKMLVVDDKSKTGYET